MELLIVLGWGSPIGISIFLVSIPAALLLLAFAIRTLAKIDKEQNSKR